MKEKAKGEIIEGGGVLWRRKRGKGPRRKEKEKMITKGSEIFKRKKRQ